MLFALSPPCVLARVGFRGPPARRFRSGNCDGRVGGFGGLIAPLRLPVGIVIGWGVGSGALPPVAFLARGDLVDESSARGLRPLSPSLAWGGGVASLS